MNFLFKNNRKTYRGYLFPNYTDKIRCLYSVFTGVVFNGGILPRFNWCSARFMFELAIHFNEQFQYFLLVWKRLPFFAVTIWLNLAQSITFAINTIKIWCYWIQWNCIKINSTLDFREITLEIVTIECFHLEFVTTGDEKFLFQTNDRKICRLSVVLCTSDPFLPML